MEDLHETFMNQVVTLLGLRRNAAVIVLAHQESGLEILSNCSDMIHKRGMLETAVDILKEVRSQSDEEIRKGQEEAEKEAKATMAALGQKGPVQ